MKDTVPIREITQTLRKRIVLILILTLGFIGGAALISYYVVQPVYQSASQFVVIQQQNEAVQFGINEIETNLGLINTYSEIIENPIILEQVMEEINLTGSLDEFRKRIEVSSGENSQVVTVSAIGDTPETAAQVANLVVEAFRDKIMTIMKIENVFVLSQADPGLSQDPITPRPILNMFIAGVIGLATSIGLALLLEFTNTKVKMERDLEELGLTVLGVIPNIDKKQLSKQKAAVYAAKKEEKSVET